MTTAQHRQPSTITVHVPLKFTIRGGRKTIIGKIPHIAPRTRFDDPLAKALARTYRWKQKLEGGTYATVGGLTKAERIDESDVTRIPRLNLLTPDIVEAALHGQTLSVSLSPIWTAQRAKFA